MWESVWTLISEMNKINYVFLRNWEDICDDFDESSDWDILCDNLNEFVSLCNLMPLSHNEICFNYYTFIRNKKLLIDVRCVGDGCYDKNWEEDMLRHREKNGNCYILESTHQKYSILYHCLLQKKCMDFEKYGDYMQQNFGEYNTINYLRILADYLKENQYCFHTPKDVGIYINKTNRRILEGLL